MRKISSSPSLHGPSVPDLDYAERVHLVFSNVDRGLSVLRPKVNCIADESVLCVIKNHLKFMTLRYVQAGFSVEVMLNHISILRETQNAQRPALLIPFKGFLDNPCLVRNHVRNAEAPHPCRVENIDIHFAYPSFYSHSAAIKALRQLTDFKVLDLQIFRSIRQGPALAIARIQWDADEVAKIWTRGLQNTRPRFAVQSLLRLLKAGLRHVKSINHYLVDGSSRCGNSKSSTCYPIGEEPVSPPIYCPGVVDDYTKLRVPKPTMDLCYQELQSEPFTKYMKEVSTPYQKEALENCLIVDGKDLNLRNEIGIGSSGFVYEGVYREQVRVAVKILKVLPGFHEDFGREVLALGLCRHNNILPLVGMCLDSRFGICVVTKFMEGGSLRDYLQRKKKLQTKEALQLARDIAEGMHFMHSRGIIHMDLKTPNILLDKEGTAVIGDLGSARFFHDNNEVRKDIGTYRWMAPEVFGDEAGNIEATPKSDVYSFGILLWELVSCEVPFADYSPVQAAVGVVTSGLRPTIPKDCFPPFKCLLQKCWSQKPPDRPSFSQILKMLKIISAHPSSA